MPVNLMMTNVDITDPNLEGLFADIQGNILKGHGRDFARHVFLKWKPGAGEGARAWLRALSDSVTSAMRQYIQARTYQAGEGEANLFATIMLSAEGYRALGFSEDALPDDKAFRAGMKDVEIPYDTRPRGEHAPAPNPLHDDPGSWDEVFQQDIHACLILAFSDGQEDSSQQRLDREVERVRDEVARFAEVLMVEDGHVLRNDRGQVIEHFGFVDGVSNPLFLRSDLVASRAAGEFQRYDSSAYLGLVLVPDRGGPHAHGSYFVYRKLQQNVKGFHDKVAELAQRLTEARRAAAPKDSPGSQLFLDVTPEFAGALVVGRFADGTPIAEQMIDGWTNLPNNWNYDNDVTGRRCPFQAHARKTNPRGDTVREFGAPPNVEASRRIARRAISYGSTDLRPGQEWTDCGLLFLSCQANIEYQFIFMQGSWSNNDVFIHEGTGIDPICGVAGGKAPAHRWPTRWGIPERSVAGGGAPVDDVEYEFSDVVRMRGGEYFFAPSISFLKSL